MSKDNWISVKDRLPSIGAEYNVVWDLEDGDKPLVTTMQWDAKEKRWEDHRGEPTPTQIVTHWQPLPDPEPLTNTAHAPIEGSLGDDNGIINCPFCGGKEGQDVFLGRLSDIPKFKISCIPCGVTLIDDRKDKVIANWNRRATNTLPSLIDGSLDENKLLIIGDDRLTELKKAPNHITTQFDGHGVTCYNTGFHRGFVEGAKYQSGANSSQHSGDAAREALQEILNTLPAEDVYDYDPGEVVMRVESIASKALASYKSQSIPIPPGIMERARNQNPYKEYELDWYGQRKIGWNECCDTLSSLLSGKSDEIKKEVGKLKGEAKFDEKTGNATYPDKPHWGEMKKGWFDILDDMGVDPL